MSRNDHSGSPPMDGNAHAPEHRNGTRPSVSRRDVLGGIAASLSLMAGCNALDIGQEKNKSNTTTPTTTTTATPTNTATPASPTTETDPGGSDSPPAVATKIPIPADPAEFSFSYYDMLRMRQLEASGTLPDPSDKNEVYSGAGGFEIPFSVIDTLLIADVNVLTGSFDTDSIITTLQQRSDATLQEVYNGYEIYVEPDRGSANAFSGETLVSTLFPNQSLTALKDTIDAMSGDGKRFYNTNDDFRTLVTALTPSPYLSVNLLPDSETAAVRNDVGRGIAFRVDNGTVIISVVVLFETPAAVNTTAVRKSLMADFNTPPENITFKDVSVEQNGRIVTFSGELNTDSLTTPRPPGTETPPTTQTVTETELSHLVSYTNEVYGYRIKYPANWVVYDSAPRDVEIRSPTETGQLQLSAFEMKQSYTLDQFVDRAISSSRNRMANVSILNRRDVTLPSGQPAHVIDMTYDNPVDSAGLVRSRYLVTIQGSIVYQIECAFRQSAYTATAAQITTKVIDSFTLI